MARITRPAVSAPLLFILSVATLAFAQAPPAGPLNWRDYLNEFAPQLFQ